MFSSCFPCQLQILRPMLCSVYLELFKSPMVCCILYFVSICPLPLDCLHPFLPVVITVKVASIWSCLLTIFPVWIEFFPMLDMFYLTKIKLSSTFIFRIHTYIFQNSTVVVLHNSISALIRRVQFATFKGYNLVMLLVLDQENLDLDLPFYFLKVF